MLNSNSGDFLRRKLEICQNLANFLNNFTALTGAFLFFCKMVKICQKQTLIVSSWFREKWAFFENNLILAKMVKGTRVRCFCLIFGQVFKEAEIVDYTITEEETTPGSGEVIICIFHMPTIVWFLDSRFQTNGSLIWNTLSCWPLQKSRSKFFASLHTWCYFPDSLLRLQIFIKKLIAAQCNLWNKSFTIWKLNEIFGSCRFE